MKKFKKKVIILLLLVTVLSGCERSETKKKGEDSKKEVAQSVEVAKQEILEETKDEKTNKENIEAESKEETIKEETPATYKSKEYIKVPEELDFDLNTMTQEKKEAFLRGVWFVFFPVPGGLNPGHSFNNDYTYSCSVTTKEAFEKQIFSSFGIWRLENNDIQIKITGHKVWDRPREKTPEGYLVYPEDAKRVIIPMEDDNWYTIGSLENVTINLEKDGHKFPPRIPLKRYFIDRLSDEEVFCYRDRPLGSGYIWVTKPVPKKNNPPLALGMEAEI